MVGRALGEMFPPRAPADGGAGAGPPALRVEGLSLPGHFEDVSFEVGAGEIVGVAGLIGAGRTAVARAIFGAPTAVGGSLALRGSVQVEGRELHPRSPRDAIAAGIAYVPEERKSDGLALDLTVVENLSLPQLAELARGGVVDRGREAGLAAEQIGALAIRTPGARVPAGNLSGGNQQKVVLGKWLARGCKVLILDEPTRGIDVGAKVEIYRLLRQLAARRVAILLISSDLLEVLGLSDRVLVMRKGRIAARVDGNDASEEELIRSALGAEDAEEAAP
jgi:ABC-type sugar transport system ATPase subunit